VSYQRKDARYRQAKAEGFRARSAYKLIELDRRFRLLRPGAAVVDIGAWPGGWMQVAAERVGSHGRVVGIDLVPVDPLPASHTSTVVGDVGDPAVLDAALERLGRPADVVLSDAAPKLSGVRARDEAACESLGDAVLAALPRLLARDGALVTKTFMGAGHDDLMRRLRDRFDRVRLVRPESSRQGSAECYLVATGFHVTAPCG
jgi:23S rRNA (uridine2552-2'-O)-methyltransferase